MMPSLEPVEHFSIAMGDRRSEMWVASVNSERITILSASVGQQKSDC